MNFISKYSLYLKDNPEGLWFKRKLYGYGWTPARWQGWAVIAVYLVLVVKVFLRADSTSHSNSDTLINFAIPFIIFTLALIIICRVKGETPRWQWGEVK